MQIKEHKGECVVLTLTNVHAQYFYNTAIVYIKTINNPNRTL